MYQLLPPEFPLGLILGAPAGGAIIGLAMHTAIAAATRRLRAEADLTRERARAAQQADAWQRARGLGAANDETPASARAFMRSGPR